MRVIKAVDGFPNFMSSVWLCAETQTEPAQLVHPLSQAAWLTRRYRSVPVLAASHGGTCKVHSVPVLATSHGGTHKAHSVSVLATSHGETYKAHSAPVLAK